MPENKDHPRSNCPIARTLDIVGDKWTLVVIRDLLCGKTRFKEFAESPEKIPTNILTERLKRLEYSQMIEKHAIKPGAKWVEYKLTRKGEDLLPVLQEISKWGNKYIEETWTPPAWFMEKKV